MKPFTSKLLVAGVFAAESSLVSAHTGDHGLSPWYHFLTSPDHAVVLMALALVGLGVGFNVLRNATRKIL